MVIVPVDIRSRGPLYLGHGMKGATHVLYIHHFFFQAGFEPIAA